MFILPAVITRGRNKPKLPLVRRISDMLKTTCPPTFPLVQVLVHFGGPKWDALSRQNSGHDSHRFFKFKIAFIHATYNYTKLYTYSRNYLGMCLIHVKFNFFFYNNNLLGIIITCC